MFTSWISFGLGLGEITRPGPGFFPFLVSVAMGCVSIISSVKYVLIARRGEEASFPFTLRGFFRILTLIVGISAFGLLLDYLGFLITTILILAFFWLIIERQSLFMGLAIAIISAACSYLLFAKLLGVHFPRGVFGL
jgi:hypothetical protein